MLSRSVKYIGFVVAIAAIVACKPAPDPYKWPIPIGFPEPIVPADNPMSEAKVALGRALFFDVNLSFNQSVSCASCHQPEFAFAQNSQFAMGATQQVLRRNSQALVNIAYNSNLTWAHSGINTIEQQILIPMFAEDPVELGITGHEKEVLNRFNNARYRPLFEQAFDESEANFERIVFALASYVRSLVSLNSPFDRYAYLAQDDAMSESALRGMELFFSERLECFHCHGGFNFTQSSQHENQRLDLRPFHNTGLYNEDGVGAFPLHDQGLYEVTHKAQDMGRFRAPTLRNVQYSAPYMHDGSLATLADVIDFYAAGGRAAGINNPLKSPFIQGFTLQAEEKQDLLAFLASLSDDAFLSTENQGKDRKLE
ncbi:MAG: di-heme enzyme [Paraglaciecola sp.]|uniref:methanobactin export MATE transporter MbnM n=1 Tax=Paraglaciecola sp. TaxID=1920173 RepID=UPI00273FBC99|nr:methanobactin export MATE transporter MbnM [Paraglaciecola sp.]MDP5029309.1 di-heme enzyme [Paraglaciecola sp.]MDP5133424.1 di-heme enzyme [Paraglaciecola sp.]